MAKPAVIRDSVIERIEQLTKMDHDYEVVDLQEINPGDRVRIKCGIFYDQEGTVIKVQGKNVLMVFDHLNCALVSNIPMTNIMLNTAKMQSTYV
ncbi:hypothetical protein D3C86_1945000 [compost metagenome]